MDSLLSKSHRQRRLLISAHDPGAALQLGVIARKLLELELLEVILLAGGPALSIFCNQGLIPIPFSHPRISPMDKKGATHLIQAAKDFVETLKPDGILVGLSSGLNCGLDEALLACSSDTPTFAMQDYWGDVNPGFGFYPKTYFVLDEFAAQLTASRAPKSRIVVTGSPRHQEFKEIPAEQLRISYRDKMSLTSLDQVVTFIGQPLWHLAGYRRTIELVAHSVAASLPNAHVIYRLHPLENSSSWKEIKDCFDRVNLPIRQDTSAEIEATICGADILLSCYSNTSLDAAMLNAVSRKPLAAFVFILIDHEIMAYFKENVGLEQNPLVYLGLAAEVKNASDLNGVLSMSMLESRRYYFKDKAVEYFKNFFNSSQDICEYLNNNIN